MTQFESPSGTGSSPGGGAQASASYCCSISAAMSSGATRSTAQWSHSQSSMVLSSTVRFLSFNIFESAGESAPRGAGQPS